MALAKLTFTKMVKSNGESHVDRSVTPFECQFNPESMTLSKKNGFAAGKITGDDSPKVTFKGGEPQAMSLVLTFDSTDTGDSVADLYAPLSRPALVDRAARNPITMPREPPWVLIQWGGYISFVAVITGIDEELVLFAPDGLPLRAKLTVQLLQVQDDSQMDSQNPTTRTLPRRTWVVEQGQRLDWIAHQEYGDSSAWRQIAEINGIDNPMDLRGGQLLLLPDLQ